MIDFAIPAALVALLLNLLALVFLDVIRGEPIVLQLLLLVFVVWFSYLSLWRVAYRLEYIDGLLICRGRFSSWAFPIGSVTRLRPAAIDIGFQVVETRSRLAILVCMSNGFGLFAKAIQHENPEIEVRIGLVGRLVERMPWPSSFRRL